MSGRLCGVPDSNATLCVSECLEYKPMCKRHFIRFLRFMWCHQIEKFFMDINDIQKRRELYQLLKPNLIYDYESQEYSSETSELLQQLGMSYVFKSCILCNKRTHALHECFCSDHFNDWLLIMYDMFWSQVFDISNFQSFVRDEMLHRSDIITHNRKDEITTLFANSKFF